MRFRPSAWKKRSRNSDKVNHQKADARVPAFFRGGKIRFFTESWWGANKGLGEAPKSCTRKEHESATDSIARRGQGAIAPCRVKGQRPLWGWGQRPNSSTGDQYAKRAQQRCRQRSVPASNSALPQERPRAALPLRFREEPNHEQFAMSSEQCNGGGRECLHRSDGNKFSHQKKPLRRIGRKGFLRCNYLAYSIERVSRMTLTRICPGYSISFSMRLAISLARIFVPSSVTSSGLTMMRTSRPD